MYLKKKGCLILSIDEKELENMSIEEKIYWYRNNIESIENTINVLKQLSNKFRYASIELEMEIKKTHKMCDHCRKYIDKRDIIIDGISIKELKRNNIHKLFTMVLQDTWLFDGTVKENIKYNNKDISDKDIKEICKVVGIDHFIKTLSNSYDSKLTESESVSSGEKQLLTIARGMAKYTPFLILDEATSNVDTRTEELVQSAMDKLMEDRTSFIIAHRLSTIKNADLILVMNDGNIIEQGTHDELMKKKGFYADLYNSQFVL